MLIPLRRLRSGEIQRRASHRHFPLVALMHPGLDRAASLQGLQPLAPGAAQAQRHAGFVQFELGRVVIDVVQAACGWTRDLMRLEQRVPLQPGKLLGSDAQFKFGLDSHDVQLTPVCFRVKSPRVWKDILASIGLSKKSLKPTSDMPRPTSIDSLPERVLPRATFWQNNCCLL